MIERRLTALVSAATLLAVIAAPIAHAQVPEPSGDQRLRETRLASRSEGLEALPPAVQGIIASAICRAPRFSVASQGAQKAAETAHPEGVYGSGHDQLHYWYQTLKQPGTGMSCCNNQDCRPTEARMVGNDVQVKVDGDWTTVPPNKILNVQPPDLNAHVCAPKQSGLYPKGYVFCVVLGSGV